MTIKASTESVLDIDLSPENDFLIATGDGNEISVIDIKS